MKHCPAAACPFVVRFGRAAEYGDAVAVCVDCGGALRDGPAPEPEAPGAAPPLPAASRGLRLRGLVSLMVAALAVLAYFTPLPSGDLLPWGDPGGTAAELGLLAVGLGPLVLGFALVELVAALVPRLRPVRYSGPRGRSRLVVASVAIGLALTLIVTTLTTSTLGLWLNSEPRVLSLLLVLAPLALYGASRVVDRFGVGGGMPLVLAAIVAAGLGEHLAVLLRPDDGLLARPDDGMGFSPLAAGAVVLSAAVLVAPGWLAARQTGLTKRPAWLARLLPDGSLPLPVSGVTPLSDLLLPVAIASPLLLFFGWSLELPLVFYGPLTPARLALMGAAAVIVGWLYHRPRNVAPVLRGLGATTGRRGELEAQLARQLVPALALSAALVVAAELLWSYGADQGPIVPAVAKLATLAAVALDLGAEWRARRTLGPLSRAWCLHRTYAVAPALAALEREGIPAFARSRHLRTLFPFLASWAPIDLLVPPHDVERARAYLAARLGGGGRLSRDAILDALS